LTSWKIAAKAAKAAKTAAKREAHHTEAQVKCPNYGFVALMLISEDRSEGS